MPVVFCMRNWKISKPLSDWGWHVCLQKSAWSLCSPSPTTGFLNPAAQQGTCGFWAVFAFLQSCHWQHMRPSRVSACSPGWLFWQQVRHSPGRCASASGNRDPPSRVAMPDTSLLLSRHRVGGQLSAPQQALSQLTNKAVCPSFAIL